MPSTPIFAMKVGGFIENVRRDPKRFLPELSIKYIVDTNDEDNVLILYINDFDNFVAEYNETYGCTIKGRSLIRQFNMYGLSLRMDAEPGSSACWIRLSPRIKPLFVGITDPGQYNKVLSSITPPPRKTPRPPPYPPSPYPPCRKRKHRDLEEGERSDVQKIHKNLTGSRVQQLKERADERLSHPEVTERVERFKQRHNAHTQAKKQALKFKENMDELYWKHLDAERAPWAFKLPTMFLQSVPAENVDFQHVPDGPSNVQDVEELGTLSWEDFL